MKLTNETKIGILVAAVAVILGFMTVKSGSFNLSRGGYQIKAIFSDIDGVNLNSPVMFNGFEVGKVEDINILEIDGKTKMELTLWVSDEAQAREGTKAFVKPMGFMGEKYVGLVSTDMQSQLLPPNSVIMGEEQAGFDSLITKGNNIAGQIEGITTNLNERLETNKENIDKILAHLNELTLHLSSLTESADERLRNNEEHIDMIISNMNETSVNIKELTQDLKQNPWKLLHKGN